MSSKKSRASVLPLSWMDANTFDVVLSFCSGDEVWSLARVCRGMQVRLSKAKTRLPWLWKITAAGNQQHVRSHAPIFHWSACAGTLLERSQQLHRSSNRLAFECKNYTSELTYASGFIVATTNEYFLEPSVFLFSSPRLQGHFVGLMSYGTHNCLVYARMYESSRVSKLFVKPVANRNFSREMQFWRVAEKIDHMKVVEEVRSRCVTVTLYQLSNT